MATLYPSLEDMKGHQILQVSVSAVAFRGGGEQTHPPGSLGLGGHSLEHTPSLGRRRQQPG